MRARLRHLHPTPPREERRPRGFAPPANDNRRPRWGRIVAIAVAAIAAAAIARAFGAI